MKQPYAAVCVGSAGMHSARRHFVHFALMRRAVFLVMPNTFGHFYFLDLEPAHFQRLRESRNGELGFLAALVLRFIWPADLAQYESPFLVPGLTRGPPSAARPAWP